LFSQGFFKNGFLSIPEIKFCVADGAFQFVEKLDSYWLPPLCPLLLFFPFLTRVCEFLAFLMT